MQKRHGGKPAPSGYYTASQAAAKLGLNRNTFFYYVRAGKIPRYVPPLKTEGFYEKSFIDKLAAAEFRVATPDDAEGIVEVLRSLGWPTTTAEQRRARLEKNPEIDHLVIDMGIIQGYINTMPLTPEAMEGMMSGRLRSWDLRLEDLQVFEPGREYDVFIGLAERPSARERGYYGMRLVLGFRHVLEDWAKRGIIIHRLLGHSDEEVGQELARIVGFTQIEGKPGDLFPRFELDLFTSPAHFAERYRAFLPQ